MMGGNWQKIGEQMEKIKKNSKGNGKKTLKMAKNRQRYKGRLRKRGKNNQ